MRTTDNMSRRSILAAALPLAAAVPTARVPRPAPAPPPRRTDSVNTEAEVAPRPPVDPDALGGATAWVSFWGASPDYEMQHWTADEWRALPDRVRPAGAVPLRRPDGAVAGYLMAWSAR